MMIEQLQQEKAEIVKKIGHNEALIKDTQDQIYLLRKQEKLIDKFIKQYQDSVKPEQK